MLTFKPNEVKAFKPSKVKAFKPNEVKAFKPNEVKAFKPNEVKADVSRLIREQFPEYGDMAITEVEAQGHDNMTYRLGDSLSIRLPNNERYALQVAREHVILPKLSQHLSFNIPAPVRMGQPSQYFPHPFSIYRWLPGKSVNLLHLTDSDKERLAHDLAKFLKELHAIEAIEGPGPGKHNYWRGAHINVYKEDAIRYIDELNQLIDKDAAMSLLESACETKWEHEPVWVHGDLAVGNMLMEEGRLTSIIDFGCTAVGDPACDLVIAWTYLSGRSREIFIAEVGLDAGTWLRARAWALWKATYLLCKAQDKGSPEATEQEYIIDAAISI